MHEIRATVPGRHLEEVLRLARDAGIAKIAVTDVTVYSAGGAAPLPLKNISLETATPAASNFIESLHGTSLLQDPDVSLTSRELRAIVSDESPRDLTQPMGEPTPDIRQDLWQLSHVTPSYLARAAAGGVLLGCGIIANSPIQIVVAALFLPFLQPVLAIGFGLCHRDGLREKDRGLCWHGARATLASISVALLMGLAAGAALGGPVQFMDFKPPLYSFIISAIIGITAGLSSADDTGRRYMLGVAASVQLSLFPTWLGVALVTGLPQSSVLWTRFAAFGVNLVTIPLGAILAYRLLHAWRKRASRQAKT